MDGFNPRLYFIMRISEWGPRRVPKVMVTRVWPGRWPVVPKVVLPKILRNEGSKGRRMMLSLLPFVPVFVQAFFNLSLGIVSSAENPAALYFPFFLLNLACQRHRIQRSVQSL